MTQGTPDTQKRSRSPVRAIKDKCLDCSGGSHNEVTLCAIKDCALWPFRKGRNPNRTPRKLTDEQKAANAARLAKARAKKVEDNFNDL